MVDQSKSSSDNQNQPNFFSETASIFLITFTSMITIYLSLLSLSIFLKFCYFHNVGKDYTGAIPWLGNFGIFIFSLILSYPALRAIGGMLGSGQPNYGGGFYILYLFLIALRGWIKGHTIPKCLPAFPGLPIYLGGVKNWEQESIYPNNNPPSLNPTKVNDINWDSTGNLFFGPINSLIVSNFKKELGMKNIGDNCLFENNDKSVSCEYITGEVHPSIFLWNKYVGK